MPAIKKFEVTRTSLVVVEANSMQEAFAIAEMALNGRDTTHLTPVARVIKEVQHESASIHEITY